MSDSESNYVENKKIQLIKNLGNGRINLGKRQLTSQKQQDLMRLLL